MAKVIIVLVVIVLVFGGAIWQEIYAENTFNEFVTRIETIQENEELTIEDINDLRDWWRPHHNILVSFMPHVQLSEVDKTLGELAGGIMADDQKSATAQLNRLKATVESLADMFNLRLNNII